MIIKICRLCLILLVCHNAYAQSSAGNFKSFEKNGSTLTLKGTGGDLVVEAYARNIFRIQLLRSGSLLWNDSYATVLKPSGTIGTVKETASELTISFEDCDLVISKNPLKVTLRAGGKVKISESEGMRQTADSVHFSFNIRPDNVFHGAGGRPFGLNLNRKVFDFYNSYEGGYYEEATRLSQSASLPFLVCSNQYGLLLDSDMPGNLRFDVGGFDSTKLNADGLSTGKWAYFLINGKSNDEILQNYGLLTGYQPLPPRWAFGYIQSKAGFKSEQEVQTLVNELRTKGFPLDAIGYDHAWYKLQGSFDWDKSKFPNPEQMVKDFAAKGIKTILGIDPYASTASPLYSDLLTGGLLTASSSGQPGLQINAPAGPVGLLDIFNTKTQSFLGNKLRNLNESGLKGWYSDRNEPELHPKEMVHVNGKAEMVNNLYSHVWLKAVYENFRKDFPQKRLFHLTRSAYVGSQRYGALTWSAHPVRFWTGLKLQIPIMIHAGMSGLAYMHSSVGGYITGDGKKEKDEELDLRWLQFSCFTPIVRTDGERDITDPSGLTEPFFSNSKSALNLRYKMLPYIYSLAYLNTTSARPICLPMDYFESNTDLSTLADQYFFGENLLVAPVLLHGMLTRKVVLPSGKWFNFWTGAEAGTNTAVFEKLTLDNIPVYVKAGAIIPLANSNFRSTDNYLSDSLTIKYFHDISAPASSFAFYHDDGSDPEALTRKNYELLEMKGNVWQDSVQFNITQMQTFAGAPKSRQIELEVENLQSIPKSVKLGSRNLTLVFSKAEFKTESQAFYNTDTRQLTVRFKWEPGVNSRLVIYREGLSVLTPNEPLVESGRMSVYPNPIASHQVITIESDAVSGDYELDIFNTAGTRIYHHLLGKYSGGQRIKHQWNSGANKGAFMVRIWNKEGDMVTKKLVIE